MSTQGKFIEILSFRHFARYMQLFELSRSIEEKGVLVPLIVRPNPDGKGYEIIAGHRRKAACEWAGVDTVPVMVMQMDNTDG